MRVVLDTNLVVRAVGDKAGLGREILTYPPSDGPTVTHSQP